MASIRKQKCGSWRVQVRRRMSRRRSALAPDPQAFRCGRDFSAWLRLTPVQKLGQITKAGERTLRRLLVIGPAR